MGWQDFLSFPHNKHPGHTAGLGEPGHVRITVRMYSAGEENNPHPGAAHGSKDRAAILCVPQPALYQPTFRKSSVTFTDPIHVVSKYYR